MQLKRLLAIDPGTRESAWVSLGMDGTVHGFGKVSNLQMLAIVMSHGSVDDALAIERIASYGMAVGAEVFETCVWTGRFIQQWMHYSDMLHPSVVDVYRKDVKLHLCGSPRAKDANIRQALIDRYGPGKDSAIGTKKNPGPLYGVKADIWAALAVGVTTIDTLGASHGLATA